MKGTSKMATVAALLALAAACGSNEPAENLEAKADEMEGAADRAEGAQADVLENNAESLRDAAKGEDKADTNGSVTVIEE